MISIAGAHFPLTFQPQMAGRELVLLGVIPIAVIEKQATGRYTFAINLPAVNGRLRRAPSAEKAKDWITEEITGWLEAAASPAHRQARAGA